MQRSPRFTALSASPRTATTRPRRTPTSTLQPVPQKRRGESRAGGLFRPVVAAGAGDRVGYEVRRDPRERRRRRPAVERALRAVAALAALVARAVVAARARRRRRGDGLVHLRRVAGGGRRGG